MTPQTQAEQKARDLMNKLQLECVAHEQAGFQELTLLIQKASERDMVVNNAATSSQIGLLIAERDSYKQKADALDWIKGKTVAEVLAVIGDDGNGLDLLSAIKNAIDNQEK